MKYLKYLLLTMLLNTHASTLIWERDEYALDIYSLFTEGNYQKIYRKVLERINNEEINISENDIIDFCEVTKLCFMIDAEFQPYIDIDYIREAHPNFDHDNGHINELLKYLKMTRSYNHQISMKEFNNIDERLKFAKNIREYKDALKIILSSSNDDIEKFNLLFEFSNVVKGENPLYSLYIKKEALMLSKNIHRSSIRMKYGSNEAKVLDFNKKIIEIQQEFMKSKWMLKSDENISKLDKDVFMEVLNEFTILVKENKINQIENVFNKESQNYKEIIDIIKNDEIVISYVDLANPISISDEKASMYGKVIIYYKKTKKIEYGMKTIEFINKNNKWLINNL